MPARRRILALVLVALASALAPSATAQAAPADPAACPTLVTAPCTSSTTTTAAAKAGADQCAAPAAGGSETGRKRLTVPTPIGTGGLTLWIPNPFDDSPFENPLKPSRLVEGLVGRLFGAGGKSCLRIDVIAGLLRTPHFDGPELRHAAHGTAAVALGLLAATMTFAIIHFWLSGIGNFGGTGMEAGQGIVRGVGAAMAIVLWPWTFDNAVALSNVLSASIASPDVQLQAAGVIVKGLAFSAVVPGLPMFISIVLVVVGTGMVIGLLLIKIASGAALGVVFIGAPILIVLWVVPIFAWPLRLAGKAVFVILLVPTIWAVCFRAFAAFGQDAFDPSELMHPLDSAKDGSLFTLLADPLETLAMLWLLLYLPKMFLRLVTFGGAISIPGQQAAGKVMNMAGQAAKFGAGQAMQHQRHQATMLLQQHNHQERLFQQGQQHQERQESSERRHQENGQQRERHEQGRAEQQRERMADQRRGTDARVGADEARRQESEARRQETEERRGRTATPMGHDGLPFTADAGALRQARAAASGLRPTEQQAEHAVSVLDAHGMGDAVRTLHETADDPASIGPRLVEASAAQGLRPEVRESLRTLGAADHGVREDALYPIMGDGPSGPGPQDLRRDEGTAGPAPAAPAAPAATATTVSAPPAPPAAATATAGPDGGFDLRHDVAASAPRPAPSGDLVVPTAIQRPGGEWEPWSEPPARDVDPPGVFGAAGEG